MGGSAAVLDTLGALTLLAWTVAMWVAVAVLAYANRRAVRPWVYRVAAAQIFLGVLGQLGHFQEHVAQVGYWLGHPNSPGWMTPWGTALADGFGQVDRSKPSLGMEILHFTGNLLFLAGIAGVMLITHRALRSKARRWARMGMWMQGIHGLEHLSLTLSVWAGAARAIGLSTWFGQIQPGPGLTTYRVWWHFTANIMGSYIFAVALYCLWRERDEIRASFQRNPDNSPTPAPAPEPVGAPA